MPSVIDRIGVGNPDTIAANLRGTPEPNSRLYHLRRFYYDTAQSTNAIQMQALKTIAGVSQIVFGTDYPFGATAAKQVQGLAGVRLQSRGAPERPYGQRAPAVSEVQKPDQGLPD